MTDSTWDEIVAKVPTHIVPAGSELYRIHRVEYGPWYFDSSADGRFSPLGGGGRGACYFGEDDLCTWIECIPQKRFTLGDVEDRQLATLTTPRDYEFVDLTVADALQDGLSVSEVLGLDYSPTHRIAQAAVSAGRDGVRWRSRKDFAAQRIAVALFGPDGAVDGPTGEHPEMVSTDIPEDLVRRACETFGYERVARP
jgi:hypothetical protein